MNDLNERGVTNKEESECLQSSNGKLDGKYSACIYNAKNSRNSMGSVPVGEVNKYGYFSGSGYCSTNDGRKSLPSKPVCMPSIDRNNTNVNTASGWRDINGQDCSITDPSTNKKMRAPDACLDFGSLSASGLVNDSNPYGYVPNGRVYNPLSQMFEPKPQSTAPKPQPPPTRPPAKLPTKPPPRKRKVNTRDQFGATMNSTALFWIIAAIVLLFLGVIVFLRFKKSKVTIAQRISEFGRTIKSLRKM